MGHRARVMGVSLLVIGLLGLNLVTVLVPDGTEYASVVDLTQERLQDTVRQIEFYKLQTGSYPTSLPELLAGSNKPIGRDVGPSMVAMPVREPDLPSETQFPIVEEPTRPNDPVPSNGSSRMESPRVDSPSELPSPIVEEQVLPSPTPNCVSKKILYRGIAVSDLSFRRFWHEPILPPADDDCPRKEVIVVDRPVSVRLAGSDEITDPTSSARQAFFYQQVDTDHYYLRAVGPDGSAFTGDDIFPQIETTDASRIGLRVSREDVAAVENGG